MSELRELYQELILDHNKNPRNYHSLEDATHQANGHNPLCGDKIKVFIKIESDIITDLSFTGSGCAISQSSASLMTSFLKGKSVAAARESFRHFHDLVTGTQITPVELNSLGKLAVFAGVQEFPARVKCASLAWHTLSSALDGEANTIKTE
jgi:nitrogen fixation NifU-like protein